MITRKHLGISLPETLLAVATSAVLASLAVAIWQSQTVARHVASASADVRPIMRAVADTYLESGEPPRAHADAGVDPDPASHRSRYLESVDVRNGVISLYFGHRANPSIAGRTLRLEPILDHASSSIQWNCLEPVQGASSASVPSRHWPDICELADTRE